MRRERRRGWRAGCGLALAGALAVPAAALEISGVAHTPAAFDPSKGEAVRVKFRLSEATGVALRFYDVRDREVRVLRTSFENGGDHEMVWDGATADGAQVPPEAYRYTLEAEGPETVRWDLSDLTGGEIVHPRDVRWAPADGSIHYFLAGPSRVNLRVGLRNDGPLLRTVLDWVPRQAGAHAEPWDGMDASGLLDLREHPSLQLMAQAFALSQNTVHVLPQSPTVDLIPGLGTAARRPSEAPTRAPRGLDYARQPAERRRDFEFELELPSELQRQAEGIAVVQEPVPIRVTLDAREAQRVIDERFELRFFVDGQFVFENEVGFLPATWRWDPEGHSPGVHYVTANLLGLEGHFGTSTIRVYVPDPRENPEPEAP